MRTADWERWARASGIAFVVLTVIADLLGGEPPAADDPAAAVISYYDGDREQILVSSFLFAVGLGFLIWFAGTIANNLRERGQGRVAATIIGAVATFAALQLVGTGLNAVLAHSVAGDGDARVTQALFDLTWAIDVVAALPAAVFALAMAVGLRRAAMIPAWLSWAGLVVAVLFVLRSTNWASKGFWSPTGGYLYVLIPLALLWILAMSVVLVRAAPAEAAP